MEKKICSACKEEKGVAEFHKNKANTGNDGLCYHCKDCGRERSRLWAQSNRDNINKKRRDRYAEDEEYRNKDKAKRILYYENNKEKTAISTKQWKQDNKEKVSEHNEKWRKANPEKVAAQKKRYREKHPEKIAASNKKWAQNNPDKVSAQHKRYNEKNREKKEAGKRRWRRENHDKVLAMKHKRRALKSGNGGSFSDQEWRELVMCTGNKCLCCGFVHVKLTPDHIVPLTKGGTSNIDNIQPLCVSCNSKKGNHHSTDYRV